MLKRVLYSIHRVLGTILSILFLVWFLSGFVMIYHTFPKVSNKDRFTHMDVIPSNVVPIDSILKDSLVEKLSLKSFRGSPYFEVKKEDNAFKIPIGVDSILPSYKLSFSQIEEYARRWSSADIIRVDTLRELEQWIPFGRLREDFPIYKFYFGNKEQHQLYISSVTGNALQFTNKDQRFWAWLGAIPHWVYFTSLRQDLELWSDVVIWLSGIGCIMCIAGLVLGIRSYIKQYRRKKKWGTPYRNFAYKWHHILGFVFGIFVFTFAFSGMMSLAKVPEWMVKVHNPEIRKSLFQSDSIQLKNYKLDYRKIFDKYPGGVKNIEWASFGDVPLYKAIIGNKIYVFNASDNEVMPLNITEKMIINKLAKLHNETIFISQIHEYDNYYVGTSDHLPLPVYRVSVADADKSTYYINPKNGNTKYYNSNTKTRRWMYQGLHSFEMGFLVKHPILWNIVMWTTMIGGTLVSATGVWLSFKYIRRKIRRIKNKIYKR